MAFVIGLAKYHLGTLKIRFEGDRRHVELAFVLILERATNLLLIMALASFSTTLSFYVDLLKVLLR